MIQSKELQGAAVGVFDSGVGGLTVAREIMRQIPNEKIVYFGDTARVPYGSKSQDTVTRYSRQIVRFLRTQDVKAIVVACNTASAYALDSLEKEIDIPIIGVVKPGARVAAEVTRNGKIGVIGTEGTIGSQIYTDFIHNINPDAKVTGKACPLFVPLVEEGLLQDPVTDEIASRYLTELIDIGIDTLILGCTHYPLLRSRIMKYLGDGIELVNPAYETAMELRKLLKGMDLLNEGGSRGKETKGEEQKGPACANGSYEFYVSDTADKFKQFANSILPYDIRTTQRINIEEY